LGTAQFSKTSSQVLLPRMPSLSSFCAVLKPGKPCAEQAGAVQRDEGRRRTGATRSLVRGAHFFHQECRDAVLVRRHVGLGVDHQDVGVRPIGDPKLAGCTIDARDNSGGEQSRSAVGGEAGQTMPRRIALGWTHFPLSR
jgi:hypothetical protein